MSLLLLYFFVGFVASIYVLLITTLELSPIEAIIALVILGCAWPILVPFNLAMHWNDKKGDQLFSREGIRRGVGSRD